MPYGGLISNPQPSGSGSSRFKRAVEFGLEGLFADGALAPGHSSTSQQDQAGLDKWSMEGVMHESAVYVDLFLIRVFAECALGNEIGLLQWVVRLPFRLDLIEAIPFFNKEASVREQSLVDGAVPPAIRLPRALSSTSAGLAVATPRWDASSDPPYRRASLSGSR